MIGYLRRHHIGLLALFVALGGTSYAATQLPDNSVGTRQIRASAVTEAKLSASLRRLLATKVAGPRGATGPAGSAGSPGSPGAPGAVTSARAYGYITPPPCAFAPPASPGTPLCQGPAGSQYAVNASFDAPDADAGAGTYCIRPGSNIDPSTAVVVVSTMTVTGEPGIAQWDQSAAQCPTGDLEVQTSLIADGSSGPYLMPHDYSFSFVIP